MPLDVDDVLYALANQTLRRLKFVVCVWQSSREYTYYHSVLLLFYWVDTSPSTKVACLVFTAKKSETYSLNIGKDEQDASHKGKHFKNWEKIVFIIIATFMGN